MQETQINSRKELIYAFIMALFAVFAVLTNTIGVKLFMLGGLALPVSILWFPLTFLVTDVVSEVYGEKRAYYLVIMGFAMNVLLLVCVQLGIALPAASFYPLDKEYSQMFNPTWRLLLASMSAYLLAQSIDVRLFHFWKRKCKGKHLWLRNNGSTLVSQLVDTVTVSFIFLYKNPEVFTGTLNDLMGLIVSVYTVKAGIALVDTPFCYLGVWAIRKFTREEEAKSFAPAAWQTSK